MTTAKKVIKQLEEFAAMKIIEISVGATELLFEATPELTGFAETNWIPTIGSPVAKPAGSRSAVSKSEQDSGIGLIQTSYKFPAIVYITNLAEYILDLNEGTSTQAPEGFVQTAIASAIQNAV